MLKMLRDVFVEKTDREKDNPEKRLPQLLGTSSATLRRDILKTLRKSKSF